MKDVMINIYVFLFARARFYKFNKILFQVSLRGMGILNYKSSALSGERSFLKSYLSDKEGVLIDVGANQGNYSREVVQICPNIRVYAFEPHPETFRKLTKSISGISNVIPINQGLSGASGVLDIYDYPSKDGSSHASLFKSVITEIHASGSAVAHQVKVTTLDEFVESQKISDICLLKVDVEGNELEVLKGGLLTIRSGKIKAIQFEFNEMNVVSRAFFRDFWKLLDGYTFYRLLPKEMVEIKSYSPLNCEIFAYHNVVAILQEQ